MTPADLPAHHCHAFWLTLSRPLSRELVDLVTAGDDVEAIAAVAANPTTPPDVVAGCSTIRRRRSGAGSPSGPT